ncbi:glutamine synthetase [Litchfieldella qijiaojingensis]|uniref:Glutamine synthetase n=1 Tax=Litchfieldella qijiaojingensis TaxID=980347 RepID=A0ABQ2YRI6_9GAMM|nr:glutamine synthetase [Halomonas qijiaojingensis]GGX91363.1 glutamine synthetase [Halomonas qijiaojingensis]
MDLISIVSTDLTAITRGRAVPREALQNEATSGCGWVPANSALTPQDIIADPNPWGSHGDLRLIPDLDSHVHVRAISDHVPDMHYVHGNLYTVDGEPWPVCPRTVLEAELAHYRKNLGWQVKAAFEHEFILNDSTGLAAPAFSLQAQRRAARFAACLMEALANSHNSPETFLPEYGQHQYEVTCRPAIGLASADRAINVREITRDIARQLGLEASFTPQPFPGGVSNGVHLHLSFLDENNLPVLHDSKGAIGLSRLGQHWAAGVLHYMPALCAFTAPSPVSYLRLQPHHWSSAYACLGVRNREAALRVCPTTRLGNKPVEQQFNLEYRALDATASPHLAMAVILMAGRLGIEQRLPMTARADQDPDTLSDEQRTKLGIHPLPASLSAALEALRACPALEECLSEPLLATYQALKRQELANVEGLDDDALCALYRSIY